MKTVICLLFLVQLMVFSSCGVNSNLMFREPKGTVSKADSLLTIKATEYMIAVDDKFTFNLFTNNGVEIINKMSGIDEDQSNRTEVEYLVAKDGTSNLPLIGKIALKGLTISQCEDTLAKLYAAKNGYNDPYVQLKVTNLRVIVFPGNGSDAKVIPLTNTNTTIMEAIALGGGITERGKASKVKLMRIEKTERKVYTFDLSTIDGLKYADIEVQANDIIYVEPNEEILKKSSEKIVPIFTVLSSAILIATFIQNLN